MHVSRQSYYILAIASAVYILSFFHRVCPAVISMELTQDFNLTTAQLSLLSGSALTTYGLMQLPSGLLVDAFGGRRVLTAFAFIGGICACIFAMAPTYPVALASRFMEGFALAVTVPAFTLIAIAFPPQMFGRAVSILLASGGIGGILAGTPLALFSNLAGWRITIFVFGIMMVLCGVLIFFCTKNIPVPQNTQKVSVKKLLLGIKDVFCSRSFWPLAVWMMCTIGTYFAMVSLWWGPYLMNGCGLSKESASLVLIAAALAHMLAQPVVGYLSDVVFKSRKKVLVGGTFFGLLMSMTFVFFHGLSLPVIIVQIILFICGTSGVGPMAIAMVKESFPAHLFGTANGLINCLAPLWAPIVQKIYASLLEINTSSPSETYSIAMFVLVGNCSLALVASLMTKETFIKD